MYCSGLCVAYMEKLGRGGVQHSGTLASMIPFDCLLPPSAICCSVCVCACACACACACVRVCVCVHVCVRACVRVGETEVYIHKQTTAPCDTYAHTWVQLHTNTHRSLQLMHHSCETTHKWPLHAYIHSLCTESQIISSPYIESQIIIFTIH